MLWVPWGWTRRAATRGGRGGGRGGEKESRECCVVVGWLPRSGGERIGGQEEKALLEMAVEAGMRNPCVHGDFRAEQRGGSGGPVLLCTACSRAW